MCSALLVLAVGLLWMRFNVAPGRTGVPFPLDFLSYFVPMTDWVARRLRAGELPLWNPQACSGMPLLATLQAGVFYPGTWLAIWLPTARALPLEMFCESVLAAHLAALLFRAWGHGLAACVAGGLLFVFGCVLGTSFWPPALATLVWLPAILLCIEKLVQGWRWRWWLGLALATALQLLAGFTQYAVFTWYLALPYAGVRLAAESAARRLSPRDAGGRLAGILAAAVLAAGLAAVQLLPTVELVGETHRAKPLTALQVHYGAIGTALSMGGVLRNAVDPSPGLITPGYGYDQGYLGMATVLLLAAGLVSGRRSVTAPLAGVALLSFAARGWISPGPRRGSTRSSRGFPPAARFAIRSASVSSPIFCVIALAVPGFDAFFRGFAELRKRRLAGGIALGGALGVAAAACVAGGPGAIARVAAVLLLCACVLLWPRRDVRVTCTAALLLLLGADVYFATRPGSGSLRAVPTAWVENLHFDAYTVFGPREVQELQQRAGYGRLAFPQFEPTLGLGALGETYRVECLDPLAPAAWNELQERISGARDPRILMSRVPPERLATAYDIAGVRAIATLARHAAPRKRSCMRPEGALASRGARTGPRASELDPAARRRERRCAAARLLRRDWKVLPRSQALARVAAGNFDFHRSVILERARRASSPRVRALPVRSRRDRRLRAGARGDRGAGRASGAAGAVGFVLPGLAGVGRRRRNGDPARERPVPGRGGLRRVSPRALRVPPREPAPRSGAFGRLARPALRRSARCALRGVDAALELEVEQPRVAALRGRAADGVLHEAARVRHRRAPASRRSRGPPRSPRRARSRCRAPGRRRSARRRAIAAKREPPSRTASRSRGAPSRCPPFTSAAPAPRFETSAQAAASTPSSVETSQPVSEAASDRLGVTSVACPIRSWSTPQARRSSSGVPSLAASTGSITSGGRPSGRPSSSRSPSSTLRATSSVASIPSFTASGRRSRSSTRSCASTTFGNAGSTWCTLAVSCTVSAVTTPAPCTPKARKTWRSACSPAPPVGSEPAMLRAIAHGRILMHGRIPMQVSASRRLASAALLLACLAATPARAEPPPTVILISLDGTRPADLEGDPICPPSPRCAVAAPGPRA